MAEKKRPKYLTKTVKFGPETLTMYSIDGLTWSTRREELTQIMERHEQARLKLMQGAAESTGNAAPAAAAAKGEQSGAEDKEVKEAPAAASKAGRSTAAPAKRGKESAKSEEKGSRKPLAGSQRRTSSTKVASKGRAKSKRKVA